MREHVTAKEWLEDWDDNQPVKSVSMGGMGDGYERAIQTAAAEIIRFLLDKNSDPEEWQDSDKWAVLRDMISGGVTALPVINELGLSGAQWGAAMNLATIFYRLGPSVAMSDDEILDRIITVAK